MIKKLIFCAIVVFSTVSCNELLYVLEQQVPKTIPLTQDDMANALKQALNKGVDNQVQKLTLEDGFLKNEAVKILMPDELKRVDKTLRDLGMGMLADEGLKMLNRAAEDAVKEATPIFVDAITSMSIMDAKNIVMGHDSSATQYLQSNTSQALYNKFYPVVKNSFSKVGADDIWKKIFTTYNAIPFIQKINPDLNDYVTNQALSGVFKMITVEEKEIRTNFNARTTDLLKRVFALQDKK